MSNKTPSEADDATALAPKRKKKPNLIFAGSLVLFGSFLMITGLMGLFDGKKPLVTPGGVIRVEIADTQETRFKGLSGRSSLSDEQGVLFVFDQISERNCLTMRDMQFPIDMVWLDEEKKVITVKELVKPETYPEAFCPERPARYALELNGAKARDFRIEPGAQLRW